MRQAAWNADEMGLTPDDYRSLAWDIAAWHRRQRWCAFKALWFKPLLRRVRHDGVRIYERNREEDWTIWRVVCATIGLICDRGPKLTDEGRPIGWPNDCYTLAYWDSWETYGGYNVEAIELFPGCRVELFNDGECLM